MNYTIQTPTPSDTSALYRLIKEHAAFEKSVASLTEIDLGLLQCQHEAIRFLVAAEGQTLLGYAALTFDWSVWRAQRYAHLDCLFVSELNRGGGIGRRLFAAAKILAMQEGVDRMEWQTPVWNEQAVRFYRREGADYQNKSRFIITFEQWPGGSRIAK
ncbi:MULTISPECIES: GNAT family N-acetyltransferase [Rhizobium/Agrobacterium group]|uniref:GNAT family N-acetyltransferase n=1 Tax=Rhizobium/Agrobacterium group TaxID=227290 RepID=UPI002300FEF9|nr:MULTISPECIES: GNAT family N-acetyltransferase [Rhizobium/Agrobacterium group]MDA5633005.1 GNAT family N-acetyltransferase [Agrobacterium sp. ST15.16.024]MDF1892044.1 GNAT family N-acetyltransferase [Rhizobium rhizogenes]